MTTAPVLLGPFTCDVVLRPIRPAGLVREERDGNTFLVRRGYELAYDPTLQFTSGGQLSVHVRVIAEVNEGLVIRDAAGRPTRVSGYGQGTMIMTDSNGAVIFRGRYYDSRIAQDLTGDDAFTGKGSRVIDHWVNGFGEGRYAGHALSFRVQLLREGESAPSGHGRGQIE